MYARKGLQALTNIRKKLYVDNMALWRVCIQPLELKV